MLRKLDNMLDTVIQLPVLLLFILQIVYAISVLLVLSCLVLAAALFAKQENWKAMGEWLKRKLSVALRIPTGKV